MCLCECNNCILQNENRGKLLSELEESTAAMFTGTIKMSTLGSFGEFYVSAWFMQRNIAQKKKIIQNQVFA